MKSAFGLPASFAMQSVTDRLQLTRTSRAQLVTTLCLGVVVAVGLATASTARTGAGLAFGIGLMLPGAGFAAPMLALGTVQPVALMMTLAALSGFVAALLLWFATGNILAPPVAWLGTAALAAAWHNGDVQIAVGAGDLAMIAAITPAALLTAIVLARSAPRRHVVAARLISPPTVATSRVDELDLPTLQLQRMLLDRALQSVEAFNGFEWRDQFQTAAVRYQLNFISYALSLAQAHHLPAFSGYMAEAQRRLLAKQSDPRMWRYWTLESSWGHLRRSADPVPRDNIMYTGFIAAQIALAEAAGRDDIATDDQHLRLVAPAGQVFSYRQADLISILADQYRSAPWGLLACEPHWIYPLCNLITATALRATDARLGSSSWGDVAETFREGLLREFTAPDGSLVPFRSSVTGLAMPAAGGIVMQAFPCLFLNALFPDLAAEHWARVRARLASQRWQRAFWPIDVGNYGFSRASSLAASAAAAVEMGDGENAQAMLAMLDQECPAVLADGVRHRPRASLWAHALEFAARCNHQGGLSDLVSIPGRRDGPHLAQAPYPDVLVARAFVTDGRLEMILYPGRGNGHQKIALAGLQPGRHYRVEGSPVSFLKADTRGTADLEVLVVGRSPVSISPVV